MNGKLLDTPMDEVKAFRYISPMEEGKTCGYTYG